MMCTQSSVTYGFIERTPWHARSAASPDEPAVQRKMRFSVTELGQLVMDTIRDDDNNISRVNLTRHVCMRAGITNEEDQRAVQRRLFDVFNVLIGACVMREKNGILTLASVPPEGLLKSKLRRLLLVFLSMYCNRKISSGAGYVVRMHTVERMSFANNTCIITSRQPQILNFKQLLSMLYLSIPRVCNLTEASSSALDVFCCLARMHVFVVAPGGQHLVINSRAV